MGAIKTLMDDFQRGAGDFYTSFRRPMLWLLPAYFDIILRFRASALGPFWISLNTGIFVAGLGVVFSQLFGSDIATYLPYLAVGFSCWFFVSTIIIESSTLYRSNGPLLRNNPIPLSALILRMVTKNLMMLGMNLLVIIVVVVMFVDFQVTNLPLIVFGLLLQLVLSAVVATFISSISARFFDVEQIIQASLQVIFLATPIMWSVDILAARGYERPAYVALNPVYHFVELVRAPVLNQMDGYWGSVQFCLIALVITGAIGLLIHGKCRRLVPLWV